jgi:hypothetical protein
MTPMLSDGRVAFPKQVASEMARAQYLDTPGDWAIGSRDLVVYPAPSDEAMAEVLGAAQLLDPQAEREEADAYVGRSQSEPPARAWRLPAGRRLTSLSTSVL